MVQTTSAGTQGLANAQQAEEIITGSYVNVQAIVDYIRGRNPAMVSLVAMGIGGAQPNVEDRLCAQIIYNLLLNRPVDVDIESNNADFKNIRHLFDPAIDWAPEQDFYRCAQFNRFPFVLKASRENGMQYLHRIDV